MMEKEGESGCGAEQAGFRFALLGFRFLFLVGGGRKRNAVPWIFLSG